MCFVLFCLLLLVLFFSMCVVWSKRTMNEQTRLQSGERPLFATLQQHIKLPSTSSSNDYDDENDKNLFSLSETDES